MSFYLFGDPADALRLKSFGAVTKGNKTALRIDLETDDPYALADALRALGRVQTGQRPPAPPKPAASRRSPKPLALPPPQLALPQPKDR